MFPSDVRRTVLGSVALAVAVNGAQAKRITANAFQGEGEDAVTTIQQPTVSRLDKRARLDGSAAGVVMPDGKRKRVVAAEENHNGATCPPHPAFVFGLCTRCGEPGVEDAGQPAGVTLRHLHRRQVVVSEAEASRLRQRGLITLLAHRKLVLVLDLDHTLLNSTR